MRGCAEGRLARRLETAGLVLLFALLALYLARPIWDFDVFWQIAAGRALRLAGSIPTTDVMSAVAPDRPWTSHQWAYLLLVEALERAGGLHLVRAVHAAVHWAAFWVFYGQCRQAGVSRLGGLVMVALLTTLFVDRMQTRPAAFNLLFECLLFGQLLRRPDDLDGRTCVRGALVMLAWANLHGGGAFVFLALALCVPGSALLWHVAGPPGATQGRPVARALRWYAALCLPALVSPAFVGGIVQAFRIVDTTGPTNFEWLPLWIHVREARITTQVFVGVFPSLMSLLALLLAGVRLRRTLVHRSAADARDALSLQRLALCLGLGLAAHRWGRFAYFAAFQALLIVAQLDARFSPARAALLRVAQMVGVLALAALAFHARIRHQQGGLQPALSAALGRSPIEAGRFPVGQAEYLRRARFTGRLFTQEAWGSYLLYRLWPAVTVVADGRGNYSASLDHELRFVRSRKNLAQAPLGPRFEEVYGRHADAVVARWPVWPFGYTPSPSRWVRVQGDGLGAIWAQCTERGRLLAPGCR